MLEINIEKSLVKEVKKRKGLAIKLNSSSMAGLPDRLILLPSGKLIFVELKKQGQKARPLQTYSHKVLRNLGFLVLIIDNKQDIKELLNKEV